MYNLYIETKVPSVNHYWLANGHKRYISSKGREFKRMLSIEAKRIGCSAIDGDIKIVINWYKKGKRRGDLDNILKVIMDSLNGIGYHDDSQVKIIIAHMHENYGVDAVDISLFKI